MRPSWHVQGDGDAEDADMGLSAALNAMRPMIDNLAAQAAGMVRQQLEQALGPVPSQPVSATAAPAVAAAARAVQAQQASLPAMAADITQRVSCRWWN